MTADLKNELLVKLQAHREKAAAEGLVARDYGYGVLVLCLPEFGEAEQLLLKAAPPEAAPPPP